MTRIGQGQIELRRERITLDGVVAAAVDAASPAIAAGRHTLELTVADGTTWLHADAARLEQVIINAAAGSRPQPPVKDKGPSLRRR